MFIYGINEEIVYATVQADGGGGIFNIGVDGHNPGGVVDFAQLRT